MVLTSSFVILFSTFVTGKLPTYIHTPIQLHSTNTSHTIKWVLYYTSSLVFSTSNELMCYLLWFPTTESNCHSFIEVNSDLGCEGYLPYFRYVTHCISCTWCAVGTISRFAEENHSDESDFPERWVGVDYVGMVFHAYTLYYFYDN